MEEEEKKETEGKEERVEVKEESKKQDSYLMWFLVIGVSLIVLVLILFYFSNPNVEEERFEYFGMEFESVMFDELPLYRAVIPRTNRITGEAVSNYNLFLRNDPRNLENIPITGKIRLTPEIIVALDPSITEANCLNSTLAGLALGQFFSRETSGIHAVPGTVNIDEVNEELRYASCEDADGTTVLITKIGEVTEIVQENTYCYTIRVSECQIVQATEKFLVGVIAHSRGYNL